MRKYLLLGALVLASGSTMANPELTEVYSIHQKGVEGLVQEITSKNDIDAEPIIGEYSAKIKIKNANDGQIHRFNSFLEKMKVLAVENDCQVYSRYVEQKLTLTPKLDELQIDCFIDQSAD